jgi:hypothetical protein
MLLVFSNIKSKIYGRENFSKYYTKKSLPYWEKVLLEAYPRSVVIKS